MDTRVQNSVDWPMLLDRRLPELRIRVFDLTWPAPSKVQTRQILEHLDQPGSGKPSVPGGCHLMPLVRCICRGRPAYEHMGPTLDPPRRSSGEAPRAPLTVSPPSMPPSGRF